MAEKKRGRKPADESLAITELGTVGLPLSNNKIVQDGKTELRWPNSIQTYKTMLGDATIAAGTTAVELMVSNVGWDIQPPENPTDEEEKRTEILKQMMYDMEHSWLDFIKEVVSYASYGFAVHEKVFRYRLISEGSKYNDGILGWRSLPIRSQDTIKDFKFTDDGREIVSVIQDLKLVADSTTRFSKVTNKEKEIPRKKFLLFRADAKKNNPFGNSPLKKVYTAWKVRTALEEYEAVGISRDLGGMPVIRIPPRLMATDATPEEKAIYEAFKQIGRNISANEQGFILLPNAYDPESKQPLFDIDLLAVQGGGKQYDTSIVINRWDKKILTALFAEALTIGQDQVGSYSLADSKTSFMAMAIENRLREIQDVLNTDLIYQTYKLNGWDTTRLPKFVYGDIDQQDLDVFSKAIQRMLSVQAIEFDREVANKIRTMIGVTPKPEDEEVDYDSIPANRSRASDGMSKGTGNGTSDNVSEDDNSVSNNEN